DLNTIAAMSNSLARISRIASSSSRASRSGQNCAPNSTMPSAEAGGGASGPRNVMVARRAVRSNSTDSVLYSTASAERSRLGGVRGAFGFEGRKHDALAGARPSRLRRELSRPLGHRLFELGGRHHLIDEPPIHRALALDALLGGAEHVGAIAAHLAFVGDAGE